MIWIQHDFYSNFVNSVGSGDTELTLSIFASEITDLVVHDTKNLFQMFDKIDVKINKRASDEEVVDLILDKIQNNNKFVRGLAYLMYEWNDVQSYHTIKTNAALLNVVGKVESCIRKVAYEIKNNPQLKRSLKKDIMAMDTLKVSKDGARSGIDGLETPRDINKKDRTVLYLVLGVAAAFGAYYLYKYFKAKKEAELLGAGGVVSADTAATTIVAPAVEVQPAVSTSVVAPVTDVAPATPQPMKTNHPMPASDVYIVAAPVAPQSQVVQPTVAQGSVNVNAVPNA